MNLDRGTFERLCRLLSRPDPPDLKGRGHRIVQLGDAQRRKTIRIPMMTRWLMWRDEIHDPEFEIVRARRGAGRVLYVRDGRWRRA
jgi:hypothetical protein